MKALFLATIIFLFFSCNEDNVHSEQPVSKIELSQFDYLEKLFFTSTSKDLEKLLPANKTLIGNNEDGLAYDFGENGIKQSTSFMFYGNNFFSDANISIEFTDNLDSLDHVFIYISKLLENKNGKPNFYDKTDADETITWIEENVDGNLYITKLTKYDTMISVNLNLEEADSDYGSDVNGEWVQRGENGEWVFVPN
jgi:hypothetical protein